MSAGTTLDRVRRVLARILEIDAAVIRRDDPVHELGFWTAADWLSLDLDIEREFGVALAVHDLNALETDEVWTVGRLARKVDAVLAGAGAA